MSIMSPEEHEPLDLSSLAGLYALDALDGADLERFEQFLTSNPEVQEEVAGYRATAAELAAITASEPPPGLRDRVLTQVANTRQDAPVVRLADRRARRGRQRLLAAAAAVLLVGAVGLGGYAIGSGSGDEPGDQLAALLARPDSAVVPLTAIDGGAARGRFVVSPSADAVMVVSDRMPVTAEGRTWEVWKVTDDGVESAGTFDPDPQGNVRQRLGVDLDGATTFLVTDEPDGGSAQPTTEPVMQATLE